MNLMRSGTLQQNLQPQSPSIWKWLLLIAVLVWGLVSCVQIIRSAMSEEGGNDLYTYWYAGLHIRQGVDPYGAFLSGTHPDLPIRFLDGVANEKDQVVRNDLQPAPGLTFPLIFLLTPFSWFSFPTAKIAWFALLMLINVLIPALLLRATRQGQPIPLLDYLLTLGIFMGFSATRYASISGQPSILVIALMLLTWIWATERPIVAGLLLGIALSKYSLALGFWIFFFLVERRPKLSLTAIGVQLGGIVGLARLGDLTLSEAVDGYIQLFLHHAPMEGIQLTSLLPGIDAYSPSLAIALTLLVGLPLAYVLLRRSTQLKTISSQPILRATFLTILTFWSLLVAYHRAYDLQVFLIAVGLSFMLWGSQGKPPLTERIIIVSSLYTAASLLLLSLPAGSLLRGWLPMDLGSLWIRIILRASTWVVMIGLALSIALAFRLTQPRLPENTRDHA
jgi:hypothetical protein